MSKFFKKLGLGIKSLFRKFFNFVKRRSFLFIGIIFTWVIPIIMLNEQIALVENVEAHLKLTWLGSIVGVIVLLKMRKQIYAKIYKLKQGWLRGVLMTLYRAVNYGFLLLVLWGLSTFSGKLYTWWLYSGISMLIGAIFYIADEIVISKHMRGGNNGKE